MPTMDGLPPSARGGHTTLLAGQRIVVFGGHYFGGEGSFVYLNDTHALDLETSTWCQVKCEGKPPAPRYNHTATLIGTKMFVFGGKGAKGALYRDMFYLDLETWHWFSVNWTTESPSERFSHSALAVGNKLVIFGGWDGTNKTFKDLWVFDTESFAWIKPKVTGTPPPPRHGHTMVLLEDGRILVFGGYALKTTPGDITGEYFNDVYTLDTETMVWTRPRTTGDFPLGTFGHSASVFDGHKLYVLGGWSGTERSPLFLGDKPLQETAKTLAREQRLQSGADVSVKSFKSDLAKSKYVHVFDCAAMEWSSPLGAGVPVSNRYGHTCTVVGPHLFLFGGWDGNRALHQLVVADLPTTAHA
ncbi:hypothetical protein H257_07351 [Aphanomyces astaci]|uniref:Uncharacterized protein n=1 Tax=Aphanomyces astaci TaxID=112090 RepID=W4GJU9_APHAT|nr:hypothetical protein H257_07351 [Aphanomyces astaci]ETV79299.1 hypothetical protein H257_07351 [Aphanomyces astaci]|eukprot:XP_009831140.1 hypothetical protein H257_07351 [Aphanomyces astaci]